MTQQLKKYSDMQADKMNAILFSIADGLLMTDYSGRIILSNRRVHDLLQIEEESALSLPLICRLKETKPDDQ